MGVRAIAELYFASALNFFSLFFRDWYLINHVLLHKNYLAIFYVSAIASGIFINAIILSKSMGEKPLVFAISSVVSTIAYFIIASGRGLPMDMVVVCSVIPVLWIWGASISRVSYIQKLVFWAKAREGISNILMVPLLFVGIKFYSICVSIFLGNYIVQRINGKHAIKKSISVNSVAPSDAGDFFYSLILSSLFPGMINYWALLINEGNGLIFGISASEAARLAMYGFQILSLPIVLIARVKLDGSRRIRLSVVFWIALLGLILMFNIPVNYAVFGAPLLAVIGSYVSVLLMNGSGR